MRNICRGIAQLVEQRSPKPRAVSSRLTTPATSAQRVLCAFCFAFFAQMSDFLKLFWVFLKFMLDNRVFLRYNNTRSGGQPPDTLERSWPGSSVG